MLNIARRRLFDRRYGLRRVRIAKIWQYLRAIGGGACRLVKVYCGHGGCVTIDFTLAVLRERNAVV